MDVEKQFRETHTTRPSLEEHNQESITSVSELNSAEPVSGTFIQGDQAKESSATIQKDEHPVQNVMNKTRAVELSRHELRMEHVVFEPGGELWNHRNNPIVIEKKSAATTIVFGDLLPSEVKGMHVSAQQEFHYENNWRMLRTLSCIQQTRQHSKWPPDHQDVVNFAKTYQRGYSNDQSIKNGSLAKLEMQQSNLGSCLAASFDIGSVRGSYLSNQKELSNKLNCNGNLTHQGLMSN
uniref:Uncharacterized protein n=1 Tax=Brassica campestris TaxID=3711 RepID=M4FIY9_BRACM